MSRLTINRGILSCCAVLVVMMTIWGAAMAVRAQEHSLAETLRDIEPLIWQHPWSARDRLRELAPALEGADDNTRALYYQRLAHSLHYLYIEDDFNTAIDAGLALVTADTPARTRLFLETLQGVRLQRDGDYERAGRVLQAVVADAAQRGLAFLSVFAAVELGFTRSQAGDNERAFSDLQAAYQGAVDLGDPFAIALVNEALGAHYSYLDEYQPAIEHYAKALETYKALGHAIYEAEATYGIAIAHRYEEQWDQALESFRHYQALTEGVHDEHGRFMAAYGLGMTYAERGDCPNALVHIARALADPMAPKDFNAELYKRQAVCFARAGEARAAREAIGRSREIFDALPELRGSRWELGVTRAAAEVEALLGESERAYALLLDYHEQSLALQKRNASERLMTLRLRMEDARKDYEIDLLREQARVDALRLEQQEQAFESQRLTTVSWIGTTCIAVVFLGLQLRNTRRFRDLSSRDDLTGLYNRRWIFNHLEKLAGDLPADRGQLSIVLIDVDNFKRINDEFGHPAGDSILETIASLGRGQLRPGDEMARVGGEEFLCVLPRTGVENARLVAQRLLERIREHRFRLPDGSELQVTVSIGIASYGPGCRDADSLYAAADDAMYRAKTAGKNQFTAAA